MKWKKSKQVASEGMIHVESVVNDHGSIFRSVSQETDVGIDAYVELVDAENATGRILAIQVKSGESYVANDTDGFIVRVNQDHLDYWCSHQVPVILVCYSPSQRIAAWISIREYVRREEYHHRTPVTRVEIPFARAFDVDALNGRISALAQASADRLILLECTDQCLSAVARERVKGLSLLGFHPDSRDSHTTAFFARNLLFDEDASVSRQAIQILAYHVGRIRWSWNPKRKNVAEKRLINYASNLCRNFTSDECRALIGRIDSESFVGPEGLGERVFDLLACCEESQHVLDETASNQALPMQRRINSLYMLYGCCDADLLDNRELADDESLGDIYRFMYADELNTEKE